MHFPKYWAFEIWEHPGPDGQMIGWNAWGWSDISEEDARAVALQRAQKAAQTFTGVRRDRDLYGVGYAVDRPLREPVLRTISDTPGARAVVTRNGYGCEVLNTERVVFVDVDVPLPEPRRSFLDTLFNRTRPADESTRLDAEAERIARLEDWQRRHPETAFRVYRTAAGLRYLLVSSLHEPGAPLIDDLLAHTGADEHYRRLCRQQKSFRARLTPKPWRCGVDRPTGGLFVGRGLPDAAEWVAAYERAIRRYSVCLHLLTLGRNQVTSSVQPVLAEHDRITGVGHSRPLA